MADLVAESLRSELREGAVLQINIRQKFVTVTTLPALTTCRFVQVQETVEAEALETDRRNLNGAKLIHPIQDKAGQMS